MIRCGAMFIALTSACSFDVTGIGLATGDGGAIDAVGRGGDANADDAGPFAADASRVVDARPPTDGCVPGCNGDVRESCSPVPDTETCPLGCEPLTVECRTLVPSNGATMVHLIGVTNPLTVPAGVDAIISSDDGTIQVDAAIVRPGGETVVAGIAFVKLLGGVSLLAVSSVSIGEGATVRIRGASPLIILSAGNVAIQGVIDVSAGCANGSNICGGPGGGNGSTHEDVASTGCAPGSNGGGSNGPKPETGGGGGAFGSGGAAGGDANGSNPGGGGGTLPGTCPGQTLVPLVGGSAGGAGGESNFGGDGGGGGGSLQITSFTEIAILGAPGGDVVGIRASGAGGRGGEDSDGGGGGGSGGGILLEAPRIHIDQATLAANGGGGGGGGNDPDGRHGAYGPFSDVQAAGGSGGGSRAGGSGGSLLGAPTKGVGGGDDTGGGGGGVGILRLNARAAYVTLGTVVISPAHTRGDPQTN